MDFIPQEMRTYNQWVCWRLEDRQGPKPTKVPYSPKTGEKASVIDPSSWCTFEEAIAGWRQGLYTGIGFVLTEDDPYCFIDLDDTEGNQEFLQRQNDIYRVFNSYSERSPSGQGLHIIIKATVPSGRKRSKVEIYSSKRYMTMTGDQYGPQIIIHECQAYADILWKEMGGGENLNVNVDGGEQTEDDGVILQRAMTAKNSEKFKLLWEGNFVGMYQSQSEADFAMIDIIAYYTKCRDQIARIFRMSSLGQREKAHRQDYVGYMVNKSFDRSMPPIDFQGLRNAYEDATNTVLTTPTEQVQVTAPVEEVVANTTPVETDITFPPGLMGEIAEYIYQASPRPVAEIALMGAVGMMAGITGRAYNISATGLNQYLLMLADTGNGKEAMGAGVDKLFKTIQTNCPSSTDFRGPGDMASGQALQKYISTKSQCFLAIVGEFGLTMQRLASQRASPSDLALKRVLLDVYNKSGAGQTMQGLIYSDKDKSTAAVDSPALTLLGESTPESFYKALDETMISDGLLPRFLILAYKGKRPAMNHAHGSVQPTTSLRSQLETLCGNCLKLMVSKTVLNIPMDAPTTEYMSWVDTSITEKMNSSKEEVLKQIWNRVHLKTLRLAGAVAVGINNTHPVVTLDVAEWCYKLVIRNSNDLIYRFGQGLIGGDQGEQEQADDMLLAIRKFCNEPLAAVRSYGVIKSMHDDKVMTYGYIHKKLASSASYRKDRFGATSSIKKQLQILVDAGDIVEMTETLLGEKYNRRGKSYAIVNFERFVE